MAILAYVGKRLLALIPQLLVIILILFMLMQFLPGDPAYLMSGPFATEATYQRIRAELGTDKPVIVQFFVYLGNVLQGNLGVSWRTGNPILTDLAMRVPATIELILCTVFLSLVIGVPIGVYTAGRSRGILERFLFLYGMVAGALPDFWLGLILIYLLFSALHLVGAPIGRLGLLLDPPKTITGMYSGDSLLTGNWAALKSAVSHLIAPVLTLTLVYAPMIIKNTRAAVAEARASAYVFYARAAGLGRWAVLRYTLRHALPPVITILGIIFMYLLGGSVLVETIFAWGGWDNTR